MKAHFVILLLAVCSFNVFAQDSSGISMVGEFFPSLGGITDMEIVGSTLFVVNKRFAIIDAVNPENYEYIWFNSRLGTCYEVEVEDQRAVVTVREYSGEWAVYIFDISDLSSPEILGIYRQEDLQLKSLIVRGEIAFVQTRDKVIILNMANPRNIQNVATIDSTTDILEINEEGCCLYAYEENRGIRIFDVSDSTDPYQVGQYQVDPLISDVHCAENRLYLSMKNTGAHGGVIVLDVSDGANPDSLGIIETPNEVIKQLSLQDDLLLISTERAFTCYDISDISNPVFMDRFSHEQLSFFHNDSIIYSRSYNLPGVTVLNIPYDGEFTVLASMKSDVSGGVIKLSEDRLFLSNNILDISDPVSPIKLGSIPIDDIVDFEIRDNYYHVITSYRYKIFDISDPGEPELRAVYAFNNIGRLHDLQLIGDFAYISSEYSFLSVLDISDIGFIREVLFSNPEDNGLGYSIGQLKLRGDYLYSLSIRGFGIIDVSDPVDPQLVGSCEELAWAVNFVILNNYAYTIGLGLIILDISNVENPTIVNDPFNDPINLGSSEMLVSDNYIFVSNKSWDRAGKNRTGLQVLGLENPENPCIVGYFETPGSAYMTAVRDNLSYVADGGSLVILDHSDVLSTPENTDVMKPEAFILLSSYPNPFNSTTTISYSLPIASQVSLKVFDLSGREVKSLTEGYVEAGNHSVSMSGEGMASGVYMVRMKAGEREQVRKVLLVR